MELTTGITIFIAVLSAISFIGVIAERDGYARNTLLYLFAMLLLALICMTVYATA